MDKLLTILLSIVAVGVMIFAFPDGFLAVLFNSFFVIGAIFLINRNYQDEEKVFLRRVFIIGLIFRVIAATLTYVFKLQEFFGGDSVTYDFSGYSLYNSWFGYAQVSQDYYYYNYIAKAAGSGWGMSYIVAAIYSVVGRNAFAVQLFNCVLGAATACLIYSCAKRMFKNSRVAKIAAILVAIFPSLILWSSQGLKDGIICFLLALAMDVVFSLQRKISYINIILLLVALMGIYSLRFYIFFAFVAAVFGSFFISTQKSVSSIGRQIAVLIVITLGLTYFGVLNNAQKNLETYGNLEALQNSRLDQARSGKSGFGKDIDVSTSDGALQALPIGLVYLMLAPFPWQVTNLRQAITLPEVIFWWTLIPFMIFGIWYSIKNRFRESLAVLVFTLLLTVSYAIFQGNVGTAYRMRAQMQIFYFIFVAVGIVIWKEKRENRIPVRKFPKLK